MFKMSEDSANSGGNLSNVHSANTTPQTIPQKQSDPEAVPKYLLGKQLFTSPKKQAFVEPAPLLPFCFNNNLKKKTVDNNFQNFQTVTNTNSQAQKKANIIDDISLDFKDIFLNDVKQQSQPDLLVTDYGNFKLPPDLPDLPTDKDRAKSVSPIPPSEPIDIISPRIRTR